MTNDARIEVFVVDSLRNCLQLIEETMGGLAQVIAYLSEDQGVTTTRERDAATVHEDRRWPDAARWTPPIQPQASLRVFWCATCGRLFPPGQFPGPTHYRTLRYGRQRCQDNPMELLYRLDEDWYRAGGATW